MLGYALLGLVAGLLGGAFGIGGGALMVPILILFFKVPVQQAVGTSLTAIVLISISGALRHISLGSVEFRIAAPLAVAGAVGAVIGATFIRDLPAIYSRRALAILLFYSAIRLWQAK